MPIPSFPNPNPGDTITAAWGQGVYADTANHEANKLTKDGSLAATGTFSFQQINPTADLTYGLGTASLRWGSVYVNVLELYNRLGMGGVQVIDSSRNLLNINRLDIGTTTVLNANRELLNVAGISQDGTVRKVVVEVANHRYKLFNSFSLGTINDSTVHIFTLTYLKIRKPWSTSEGLTE